MICNDMEITEIISMEYMIMVDNINISSFHVDI